MYFFPSFIFFSINKYISLEKKILSLYTHHTDKECERERERVTCTQCLTLYKRFLLFK